MLRTFPSASRSVLVILLIATLAVAAGSGSSFAADDVTVYRIQNRWKQFIYDAGAKVAYDQGGGDAKHRWVLEEMPAGQRIKNLATGAYLAADKDAPEAKLVQPIASGALDNTSLWTLDVVSGAWLSIKSCATGKYLNCEPIWGDHIARVVTWKGAPDLSPHAGRPVRLRFEMSGADLFSIRFIP